MQTSRKRILVLAKTYPVPSSGYDELVCSAGIDLGTGRLIRLHPVRFRDLEDAQKYPKWSVIEADVFYRSRDPRGDTFSPIADSIRVVEEVGKRSKRVVWSERNPYLEPHVKTLEGELYEDAKAGRGSLGVVHVFGDARLRAEQDPTEWSEKQRIAVERENLFEPRRRPLQKVPWKFIYEFRCCSTCPGHKMRVLDWEPHRLYLREWWNKHDDAAAKDAVLKKYNEEYSTEKRDIHVFVGTHSKRKAQFMVIGIHYPPRV